jgi:hypothetical protein
MEVNKKIIFSILLIGFLVITASASTWADFQDVISSKENSIQIGSIALWVDYTPATPDGQATVSGNKVANIIPDKALINGFIPQHMIKTILVQNFGTVKGKLYAQCRSTVDTLGNDSGVVIRLYDGGLPGVIYNNGVNYAHDPIPVTDILPGGTLVPLSLTYSFGDSKVNQNQYENKELKFDLIFTLKPSQ